MGNNSEQEGEEKDAKPAIHGVRNLPSAQELREIFEASELYQSNAFKLQVCVYHSLLPPLQCDYLLFPLPPLTVMVDCIPSHTRRNVSATRLDRRPNSVHLT